MATDATNQMRAMIAELMGSAGSQVPDEKKTEKHEISRLKDSVRDARNCRMFLLGTCPHEILEGTRYDIGQCRHRHEFALRADYNTLAKDKLIDFEDSALSNLQYFLRRHRQKIEQLAEQLKRVQEDLSTEVRTKANVVLNLNEEIGKKLAEVEKLGTEGKTDECEKTMREVEELKVQKKTAEFELRQATPSSLEQQQKLRVCEVCAAYIGINDNDQRLADHFGGKLHLGFLKLIENEAKLQASVKAKEELESEERKKRLAEREKQAGSSQGSNRKSGTPARDDAESSSSRRARNSSPGRVKRTTLSPPIVIEPKRRNDRLQANGRNRDRDDYAARRANPENYGNRDRKRHSESSDDEADRRRKAGRYVNDDRTRAPRDSISKQSDRRRRRSSSSSSSSSSSLQRRGNMNAARRNYSANVGDARKAINETRREQRQKSAEKIRKRRSSSSLSSSSSRSSPVATDRRRRRRESSSSSSSNSSDSVSRRYRANKNSKSTRNETKRENAVRRARDSDASSGDEKTRKQRNRKSPNGVENTKKSSATYRFGSKSNGGSVKQREDSD